MAEPVVVFGAGGHARVVIDALRAAGAFTPIAALDPQVQGELDGVPVRGGDETAAALLAEGVGVAVIGIGSVGDPAARRRVHDEAVRLGFTLPAIVHPGAHVAATARLGAGCFVAAGAVVGPLATLGDGVIVNSNAVIDHECRVGAFAHVAPGAAVSGGVDIGDAAHIGTGAAVVQGVRIGARAVVGAGAAVVVDVPDDTVVVGVPARSEPR